MRGREVNGVDDDVMNPDQQVIDRVRHREPRGPKILTHVCEGQPSHVRSGHRAIRHGPDRLLPGSRRGDKGGPRGRRSADVVAGQLTHVGLAEQLQGSSMNFVTSNASSSGFL